MIDTVCPTAPYGMDGTAAFSAADFCTLYAATCSPPATGYTDPTACATSYAQAGAEAHCRTYQLCAAANTAAGSASTHCPFAVGNGMCSN
jgi:hypothetical protein